MLQGGQGSGLGLYSKLYFSFHLFCILIRDHPFARTVVSKGIMDLHQGNIGVYSEGEGCGTTFYFELPITNNILPDVIEPSVSTQLVRVQSIVKIATRGSSVVVPEGLIAEVKDDNAAASGNDTVQNELENTSARSGSFSPGLVTSTLSSVRSKRILIVDDAITNRKMIARLLMKSYETEEASDGLEAVEKVKDSLRNYTPYDIILMDFVMPHMDGPTATGKIRALGFEGIIIGVTGNALPEDIRIFMANGADRVLSKPLELNILFEAISGIFFS